MSSIATDWYRPLIGRLNGPLHKQGMYVFLFITLAHWLEHLLQAFQIYVLGWPASKALGALGLLFPWLVTSEWLHYIYAVLMLICLLLLRPGFLGRGKLWWDIALGIQLWHHFEHALLLGQAMTHHYLFGATAPTSILQLVIPRVELHLFYNALVTIPMLTAAYFHTCPPAGEPAPDCSCALHHPRAVRVKG